jgi:uncharacterized protein (DUF779 family)
VVTLDERLDDGPLGLECSAEIEDITLEYRDFEYHLFLFAREYLHLDKVELFGDMVELGETRIEENFEDMMEEPGGIAFEVEATLALTLFKQIKKTCELVDGVAMAGDEVLLGQDDIQLTRIGSAEFGIKEGDMNRKKQTPIVLNDFGLIGRGDQFLDSEGVDIEVLLEVGDIIRSWVLEINPRKVFVLYRFH